MKTALIFFALLALGCSAQNAGPSACERQLTLCRIELQTCRGVQ